MSCTFCLARWLTGGVSSQLVDISIYFLVRDKHTGMAVPYVELAMTRAWVFRLCLMPLYSTFNYLKLFRASKNKVWENVLSTSDLNAEKETDACQRSRLVHINLTFPNRISLQSSLISHSQINSHIQKYWAHKLFLIEWKLETEKLITSTILSDMHHLLNMHRTTFVFIHCFILFLITTNHIRCSTNREGKWSLQQLNYFICAPAAADSQRLSSRSGFYGSLVENSCNWENKNHESNKSKMVPQSSRKPQDWVMIV